MDVKPFQTLTSASGVTQVVCLTGPEASGKSTLALALRKALGGYLVPELARGWLSRPEPPLVNEALLQQLASAQQQEESLALASAPEWLILDTDVLVLELWWYERFAAAGAATPPWLLHALNQRSPRCYLLCAPEMPWEPDPLRQNPLDRCRLYKAHEKLLRRDGYPWQVCRGTEPVRVAEALTWLTTLSPG